MQVKALRLGYYNHIRIKPGVVFIMRDEDYRPKGKDGQPLLDREGKPRVCSWVQPFDAQAPPQKKKATKGKRDPDVINGPEEVESFEDQKDESDDVI